MHPGAQALQGVIKVRVIFVPVISVAMDVAALQAPELTPAVCTSITDWALPEIMPDATSQVTYFCYPIWKKVCPRENENSSAPCCRVRMPGHTYQTPAARLIQMHQVLLLFCQFSESCIMCQVTEGRSALCESCVRYALTPITAHNIKLGKRNPFIF